MGLSKGKTIRSIAPAWSDDGVARSYRFAQDYAQSAQAQNNYVTSSDEWVVWLNGYIDRDYLARIAVSDAPYSFWLGTEG